MPDRETLIKAWEIFRDSNPYEICSGREFRAIREPEYCMGQMIEDTIALLKKQEAMKPISKSRHGANPQIQHFCRRCNAILFHHKQKYCIECGQAVKWGDI